MSGRIPLRGVGYTPTPAETKTAKILELNASLSGDACLAAIAIPDWQPGDEVSWKPLFAGMDAGRGTVIEVIREGAHARHGMTKRASADDPLLGIKVHGKRLAVLRHASSVAKGK